MTKLWNAFSFINMHTAQDYMHTIAPAYELGVVNQWILDTSTTMLERYKAALDKNEFGGGLQAVEKMFWNDFCDNYIEIVKDQFFHPENYTPEQIQATRWTLYTVGLRILQCYAPYLPHITENIYQIMYKRTVQEVSLHTTQLPKHTHPIDVNNNAAMEKMLSMIAQIRKLKSEHQLSLKTELTTLSLHDSLQYIFQDQANIIKGVTNAKEILYCSYVLENKITENNGTWSATIDISI
jgi:valyl-tRNA synthetase